MTDGRGYGEVLVLFGFTYNFLLLCSHLTKKILQGRSKVEDCLGVGNGKLITLRLSTDVFYSGTQGVHWERSDDPFRPGHFVDPSGGPRGGTSPYQLQKNSVTDTPSVLDKQTRGVHLSGDPVLLTYIV